MVLWEGDVAYSVRLFVSVLMLSWLMVSCGYKGELHLPKPESTQKETASTDSKAP